MTHKFFLTMMGILFLLLDVGAWVPYTREFREAPAFRMSKDHLEIPTATSTSYSRRSLFGHGAVMGSNFLMWLMVKPYCALSVEELFRRETDQFRYEFQIPSGFPTPSQKPLKTHLDEVNFQSADVSGYQFGITVDPVRIPSLTDFGTPEEVAAKVVLAEVNRDGVFDVKLMNDPVSVLDDGITFYQLNYLSTGKRGAKRYIAKFYIENQKLFALTAQCKEENYKSVKQGMIQAVNSFRIVT